MPQELRFFLFEIEGFGHFWALFLNRFFLNMAILGVFGKLCFSPFLVIKIQMRLTGSITKILQLKLCN